MRDMSLLQFSIFQMPDSIYIFCADTTYKSTATDLQTLELCACLTHVT